VLARPLLHLLVLRLLPLAAENPLVCSARMDDSGYIGLEYLCEYNVNAFHLRTPVKHPNRPTTPQPKQTKAHEPQKTWRNQPSRSAKIIETSNNPSARSAHSHTKVEPNAFRMNTLPISVFTINSLANSAAINRLLARL